MALDEVIVTPELDRRPARTPEAQAENQALHALARQLGNTPQELLESLVAFARELCQAGSAGVSVLVDGHPGEQLMRWEAVAGDWAGYAGTSTRAETSPSAPCLASGSAMLYSCPARHFTSLAELRPPLVEALFIPFSTPEGPLGTIWVAAHDTHRKFDTEDVRILTSLAGFMAPALRRSRAFAAQREQVTLAHEETDLHVQLNASLRQESQASDALRQLADDRSDRLEELDRLKDDLLAIFGHDLRSPLASIKGYAQVLQRLIRRPNANLEQVAQGLTVIDAQTDVIGRSINNLLDAARIRSGVLAPRREWCDFHESLTRVLSALKPDDRARVDVTVPMEPLTGHWERQMIEQVLVNLLENALKYSPAGSLVRVEIGQRSDEVAVAISDKGIGIPAEELPGLFERFHRAPQAQASGRPGVGLGLFICRGILEAHGGHIWAESPGENQGTAFRFTLPRGAKLE